MTRLRHIRALTLDPRNWGARLYNH